LEDAQSVFTGWARDPSVTRFLTWRPHEHVQQTREFLARCLDDWQGASRRVWLITRFGEEAPIGSIELRVTGSSSELGYALAREAWGQGLMTEAVQTLTQMALHEIPVARVAAVCDVHNVASARVLEKTGMLRQRRTVYRHARDQPRDAYLYARSRPVDASMRESDVIEVLDVLALQQTPVWIGGGWGIDALIGRQTRDHVDLDLACRAEDETTIIEALQERGYRIVLNYRPARLALADDQGREVDLHPVRFDQHGTGIQQGLRAGEQYDYPPDAFATGLLGGRQVPCLSAEQQLRFHSGYELRDRDRQDLANLRRWA
jgi:lincosamide nucleotidyltransferase A/C/D/E